MNDLLKFLFIAFFLSCGKEEPLWDKLTAAEQAAVRAAAEAKCLNELARDKNDFKSESGTFNRYFSRGDTFKFEYKNGSTLLQTIKITFLKVNSTDFYAWYVNTSEASSQTTSEQLIYYTTTNNDAIVDKLIQLHCSQDIELSNTAASTWSYYAESSAASEDTSSEDITRKYYRSFVNTEPAFFGDLRYKEDKLVKNLSSGQVTTTNYTSTFTQIDDETAPTLAKLNSAEHCTISNDTPPIILKTLTTGCAVGAFGGAVTGTLCDVCPQ